MRYLIIFLILISSLFGKDAMCFIEDGVGFSCDMNEDDEFYWDGRWHKDYVIWSTYQADNGILYISIVHNNKEVNREQK